MLKISLNKFFYFIVLYLGCLTVGHANSLPIEYAYPNATVWTTKKDANNVPYTPFTFFAKDLFSKAKIPLWLQPYPAKRMYAQVKSGRSHFSILVKTPLLKECCLYSQKPVTTIPVKVYYRTGHPAILSKEDLLGKNLVMIRGYRYGKLKQFIQDSPIKSHIRIARDHREAFYTLIHRDIDEYVLDYAPVAEELIQDLPQELRLPPVGMSSNSLFNIDVYLVLHKSYPDAENVMKKLEKIAETMDINTYIRQVQNIPSS